MKVELELDQYTTKVNAVSAIGGTFANIVKALYPITPEIDPNKIHIHHINQNYRTPKIQKRISTHGCNMVFEKCAYVC